MNLIGQTITTDSLFSSIITLYIISLLYFPPFFLHLIFSPVVFSTLILLLYLLRIGAAQKPTPEKIETAEPGLGLEPELGLEPGPNIKPSPIYSDFVEWDVRAPLEVIYEEYELGEEVGENDAVSEMSVIQRYASLSLFYPESDSDCSSEGESPAAGDWDSPENVCFRWEDDDREEMIEIALGDEKRGGEEVGDEDGLIEIDIFPAR